MPRILVILAHPQLAHSNANRALAEAAGTLAAQGADVMLNLESCGAIAITGDPDETAVLVNSMALELAASVFSDSPTVLTVGRSSLPAAPEHERAVRVDEALSEQSR